MSGQVNTLSLSSILSTDSLQIHLIPQKKGLILRHFEYLVKSERFRSEVNRRYSDFQALHDLLLLRFPYRIIPKLPPAKLLAIVADFTSDVIDSRRKALTRWLTIVTSHPVFSYDPIIKVFLTDTSNDFSSFLRDQFRHLPDEFIISCAGPKARDASTPGLRAAVGDYRSKMDDAIHIIQRLGSLLNASSRRHQDTVRDLGLISKEVGALSTSDISPASAWSTIRDQMYKATSQLNTIGDMYSTLGEKEDSQVVQKALLLLDVLMGFQDLAVRHEKGLPQDHKRGLEKIGMVKRRDTRGILMVDGAWREQIEKQVAEHEIVLSDLESRQAFALMCLNGEVQLCMVFFEILGDMLKCLSGIESKHLAELSSEWTKIFQNYS